MSPMENYDPFNFFRVFVVVVVVFFFFTQLLLIDIVS